jgi:hypothetical protein
VPSRYPVLAVILNGGRRDIVPSSITRTVILGRCTQHQKKQDSGTDLDFRALSKAVNRFEEIF